jgi:5-methylcytosine-specific restriction protein A
MKISEAQISAAYQVAKMVFDRQIKASRGIVVLVSEHGLNKATAGDFINDYKYLLEGRVFHRAMSAPAMRYFLEQILADHGIARLTNAVSSLRLHIEYFEEHYKITMHSMRSVADDLETLCNPPKTKAEYDTQFDSLVESSLARSQKDRLQRLENSCKIPKVVSVQTTIFVRNPDVVAETLSRAQGNCDACQSKAPFFRAKDGTPYLEVHHKIRLADGGEDALENSIALCPNCHRRFHFGAIDA